MDTNLSETKVKVLEDRPYQKAIIADAVTSFVSGMEAILIESATGSGKTVMGMKIASELVNLELIENIAWVVMRRELLAQAKIEQEQMFPELTGRIRFCSLFDESIMGLTFDLMVFDENRHEACATAVNIISTCVWKYKLGLDATPYRTDSLKMQYQKKITNASARELMRQGFLSPVHMYMIDAHTPQNVAAHYLADVEKWGKTVMYFNNYRECCECNDILRAHGILSEVVTGGSDRETQISGFTRGGTQVLINMYILTEGFDYPALQTVFVRDSSKGPTIQMAGRSFRKSNATGKEFANVVQSVNSTYPINRYCKVQKKYRWDSALNIWHSNEDNMIKINKEVARIIKKVGDMKFDYSSTAKMVLNEQGELVEVPPVVNKMKKVNLATKSEREKEYDDDFDALD
jgi:superfamily II DNA or RNA helicase